MQIVHVGLRALELLWVILLTALIGNVIASNRDAAGSAEAAINFSMFVIVLSWLVAFYGLIASVIESLNIPIVAMGADAVATVFTFIDAIVLAAKLRAVNCSDTSNRGSDWIAYGSGDDQKRCREVQASTVFMWFLFASFAATLFFSFTNFHRGGGSIRPGPHMSQVRV